MKKLIVIGGGFAGSLIAKSLERHFEVVLIDTKDYFEFTPSVLRTIVEPEHIRKIQVLHMHYLKKAKFIREIVKDISSDEVILENKRIRFDYLAICSGSGYDEIFKEQNVVIANRAATLRNCYDGLCMSKRILIIGGGIVGVELAAEIVDHYNGKEVTIVHSRHRLMQRNHKKASYYAENFLRKKGVNIVFNERVMESGNSIFHTSQGNKIMADMAFICTGVKPNSGFLKNNFKDKLDSNNCIKVNSNLQVEGRQNIFAVGDVAALKEEKTAQSAEAQAMIVVKNIISLESGKELHEYKASPKPMVISLGKRRGIFTYGNINFNGFVPALMKTFIEWKTMARYI